MRSTRFVVSPTADGNAAAVIADRPDPSNAAIIEAVEWVTHTRGGWIVDRTPGDCAFYVTRVLDPRDAVTAE